MYTFPSNQQYFHAGSDSYNLKDIYEVRDGYQTDIFNKIEDKGDISK